MIISISGKAGSGKSTIAKLLAKNLGFKHYSSGDFMREIAKDMNITLLELSKLAEKEKWIDKELDYRQIELGKKEDNFVIDGRLSWHFFPHSLKIYLDVDNKIAANRIWSDKDNRKNEGFKTKKELIKSLEERQKSEIKRYKKYYGLNFHDKKNYDLVIDTSNKTIEDIIKQIIKLIKD